MQLIVMYVENMLRLESGAIGDLVGSTMLVAIVDRLIDMDVSFLIASNLNHWSESSS